jgi:DNA repair exonuclease SbcCD ATPase subunit
MSRCIICGSEVEELHVSAMALSVKADKRTVSDYYEELEAKLEMYEQTESMKVRELEAKVEAMYDRINMFKGYRDDYYELEEQLEQLKDSNFVTENFYKLTVDNDELRKYSYDLIHYIDYLVKGGEESLDDWMENRNEL